MGRLNSSRAQVSIEMIVILAAVVALVLILVGQLQKTGTEGAQRVEKKAKDVFDKINAIK